jgi:hypothetical protein
MMAEYDKRRLYWIKLTDRFISSDTVDFLMSQRDGANYVVLYQMLCLKTVNNGGVLARELGEIIVPYEVDKIQRDCKWFTTDTVRVALELYKKLGLIYENQDGYLAISDFDKMIGSQSYGAEKKELQKQRREQNLLGSGNLGGKKVENFPPDIDIEKDKDIDIEKDKYIHSFTTTTTAASTNGSTEPPPLSEIYIYFKNCGVDNASNEANLFEAYNAKLNWSCLPNWELAADLWIARIGGQNG